MSIGIGGTARMVAQDAETVIYEYSPYNLNEPQHRNRERIYDGLITINKSCLVEPEIHEKIKRWPSGRKQLVVKRIPRDVDFGTRIQTGQITVENSQFCWQICSNGIGHIAMRILYIIFNKYQKDGKLPEETGYHV